MDDWEKFNETSLSEKDFYSLLNMEHDVDYAKHKKVCNDFDSNNFSEYHDLYDQSDTFLLADVFNNFWNMSPEINELDPAHFLSAPVLA